MRLEQRDLEDSKSNHPLVGVTKFSFYLQQDVNNNITERHSLKASESLAVRDQRTRCITRCVSRLYANLSLLWRACGIQSHASKILCSKTGVLYETGSSGTLSVGHQYYNQIARCCLKQPSVIRHKNFKNSTTMITPAEGFWVKSR